MAHLRPHIEVRMVGRYRGERPHSLALGCVKVLFALFFLPFPVQTSMWLVGHFLFILRFQDIM